MENEANGLWHKPCKHCGIPTKTPDETCNNCRCRIIALDKLSEFREQFQDSSKIFKQINEYTLELNRVKQQTAGGTLAWLILLIFWVAAGPVLLMLIGTIITSCIAFSEVVATIVGFCSISGAVCLFALSIVWIANHNSKHVRNFNQNKSAEINKLEKLIRLEFNKLESLYKNTNQYVPMKYSESLDELEKLIKNKQADSLKEAIQIMEDNNFKNNLLSALNKANASLKATALASSVSAVVNTSSAMSLDNINRRLS